MHVLINNNTVYHMLQAELDKRPAVATSSGVAELFKKLRDFRFQ